MSRITLTLGALGIVAIAGPGCTAITDFGHFHAGEGIDGSIDGGGGIDGGGLDVGPHDGGPDTGIALDAGVDGGADAGLDAALVCTPSCGATEACCMGTCTDIGSVTNCRGCGTVCPDYDHASPRCDATGCASDCESGYMDCDSMPSTGCERSVTTVTDCGTCGHACGAGEVCSGGTCMSGCGTQTNCSGTCANTATDVDHCGTCINRCPDVANATRACTLGACSSVCVVNYQDCNGNMADGCEPLVTMYVDNDSDGFGDRNDVGALRCPGTPGYSTLRSDCDDAAVSVSPAATERCNGVDDNCNAQTDEGLLWSGLALGQPCACEPGAASGVVMCISGAPGCTYTTEVCNGRDDDCDTMRDETFSCVAGTMQSCTGNLGGCTYVGSMGCDSTCVPGTCMPPSETCNGVDDDCDTFPDEQTWQIQPGVSGFGGANGRLRASARTGGGAVVWLEDDASGRRLSFRTFDTTGAPTGVVITLVSSPTSEISAGRGLFTTADLGFDGADWQVFYAFNTAPGVTEIRRIRVSVAGAAGAPSTEATGPQAVAVAVGAGGIGVVMGGGSQILVGVFGAGSWARTPTVAVSGSNLDFPEITAASGARFIAVGADYASRWVNSVQFDSGTVDATLHVLNDGSSRASCYVAWDGATASAVLTCNLFGTTVTNAIRYNPSTAAVLAGPLDTGMSSGTQLVVVGGQVWLNRRDTQVRLQTATMRLFPESYGRNCYDFAPIGSTPICFNDGITQQYTCP